MEAWIESIGKMRALGATSLYLPHFGLAPGSVSAHLDILEEKVRRWANWFRERMSAGTDSEELTPAFAAYESVDLQEGGATEEEVVSYEAADPSYMAVTAALRYWHKRDLPVSP